MVIYHTHALQCSIHVKIRHQDEWPESQRTFGAVHEMSNILPFVIRYIKYEESEDEVEVTCNFIGSLSTSDSNTRKKRGLYVPIKCNKAQCVALLDTGAETSVVSEAHVNKHNWIISPISVYKPRNLKGPNKNLLEIVGSVVLDTKLTIANITKG